MVLLALTACAVPRDLYQGGRVNVKDYGAKGDGVTDDTAALAAALAAARGKDVDLVDGTYAVQRLRIHAGTRSLSHGKLVPLGTYGEAVIELDGGTLGGEAVAGLEIRDVEVDATAGPRRVVYCEGCARCVFSGIRAHGLAASKGSVGGIVLTQGAHDNVIADDDLEGTPDDVAGVMIGLASAGADPDYYSYFENADGTVTYPPAPCHGNQITRNRLSGGQQGIWIAGSTGNVVTDNQITAPRDRGVILIASTGNTITGNTVLDFGSSGVHMAYGSSGNLVRGNLLASSVSHGEAGIQAYVGSNDNVIVENQISASSNFGIYFAVSSCRNLAQGNRVEGFARAALAIDADWNNPLPAGAKYSRPNYGAPAVGARWAFTNAADNRFVGNVVGEKRAGATAAAIYLGQLPSPDGTSNFVVSGGEVSATTVSTTTVNDDVYVYQSVPGGVAGVQLRDNTFAAP